MGFWIKDFFSYWDKGVFDEAINQRKEMHFGKCFLEIRKGKHF